MLVASSKSMVLPAGVYRMRPMRVAARLRSGSSTRRTCFDEVLYAPSMTDTCELTYLSKS